MTTMQVLGPGSSIPDWGEKLELLEFGSLWGSPDDLEIVCLLDKSAFAMWRLIPNAGEAELLRIAVTPAQRRSGVAKRLMNECTEYLNANGCNSLHLEVRISNLPARKLYESLGWQQISHRKAYYSDGEDAVVYSYNQKQY